MKSIYRIRSRFFAGCLLACVACHISLGEDRTYDGIGNNRDVPIRGASNQPLARITYPNFDRVIDLDSLPSPREISNAVSAQDHSIPSRRGLSDFIWAWGQFVAHDLSLSLTSNGADENGAMPIPVTAGDPLGPDPIPFVRSDFQAITSTDLLNEFTPRRGRLSMA